MVQRIAINGQHGGFRLSEAACRAIAQRKGIELVEREPDDDVSGSLRRLMGRPLYSNFAPDDLPRDDCDLVAVIAEIGEDAGTHVSSPRIVEIPDGVEWQIEEYDGLEWVAEKHRTWA